MPTSDPDHLEPLVIVHPIGYTGAGGPITIGVCVQSGSEQLIPALKEAIDVWNALEPRTGNCRNCVLWEEPEPQTGAYHAGSALLHELGHCAMGLGHVNLIESRDPPASFRTGTCDVDGDGICGEPTSFTASANATEVSSNSSTVRGDHEDLHVNQCPSLATLGEELSTDATPLVLKTEEPTTCSLAAACPSPAICCPACPGPDCPSTPMQVHDFAWFRRADNNPVVIDNVVIDKDTFSRSVAANLPPGHRYAASANRKVAESLGFANTQAVMYSNVERGAVFTGLGADDVNMVKMGMTGADRDAGTADDYSIRIQFEADCAQASIRVSLSSVFLAEDERAACFSDVALSFPQGLLKVHYSMTKPLLQSWMILELDPAIPWDFSTRRVFSSGFETGDFSEWSSAVPGGL
ncbi:MAG: hypothetical protein HC897_19755 [Thermoanaerobaculia bacterium]|nr:hypothetical protein [Thermoanaerobaculia bacterium]